MRPESSTLANKQCLANLPDHCQHLGRQGGDGMYWHCSGLAPKADLRHLGFHLLGRHRSCCSNQQGHEVCSYCSGSLSFTLT